MRAVAHGFKPDEFKGPTKKVAKEFVRADEHRSSTSRREDRSKKTYSDRKKERQTKLEKWAHGNAKSNVGQYPT